LRSADGVNALDAPCPALNLLVLRSPDIARAVKFYEALGLEFTRHAHGKGPEHFACSQSGFTFEIYPLVAGQVPTTGVRIGFNVTSVDELLPRLVAIGATIVSPATDSEWGRRAVVKDLDGHTVELVTR
jgi:predicted enzyme related to lactoylglutathione lyase